jgi:hypothetical protein
MSATSKATTTNTTNEPASEPSAAATTPSEPAPTEPTKTKAKATESEPKSSNVWDDPNSAKAEIEKLRRENGAARTNAKAQAAEEAKKELAQTIGKALGLVEDEQIDPAKLTESLTASQAEAKRARVELGVFRAAGAAGGDPAALLDSSSFLKSLDSVDPNDGTAIAAAIASAVEANPRLGVAPGDPKQPAPNPAQGTSATGAIAPPQLTRADLDRMSPEAIEEARAAGRFDDLLSGKK